MLLSGAAAAQVVQQSDLEHCASLATVELKLACFEALTAAGTEPVEPSIAAESAAAGTVAMERDSDTPGTTLETTSETVGAPVEASPDAVAAGAVAASASAVPDTADASMTSPIAEPAPASEPAPEPEPEPEPAPAPVAEAQTQDIPEEFGREHLDDPGETEQEVRAVTATVTKVEQRSNKILYFYFENGQVWRQSEGRRFRYPRNDEFDVTISEGMMGDYRLRLADGGPLTQVKRVR